MLSSESDKGKLFAKNFSKNCNIEDSSIPLSILSCGTNLKHNISATLKMVKKIMMNLHSLKMSGPDCIPVVVPKNCKPGLS